MKMTLDIDVSRVDQLVASGAYASREEAVNRAIEHLASLHAEAKRESILDLEGQFPEIDDFDYEALRRAGEHRIIQGG
ncbi:MAG: hypothetical protein ACFB21_01055 [Opitutales bacterium]